jgi:HK97 family phage prohead protease
VDLETKTVPFQITDLKAEGDEWLVSGLAAAFGNLDHTNDVIMRGAFDATLSSNRKRRFLWQHDIYEPIGVEQSLKVEDRGLLGTWKISQTARGRDAYELLKDGAVDSFSIGYRAEDFEYDDSGVRLLKQIELFEVSLVSVPANDLAIVTAVKADVPFDALMQRVSEALSTGVAEAKALHTRRAQDGRELSERHLDALKALLAQVEAVPGDLSALLPKSPEPEAKAEQEDREKSAGGDILLRLRSARHRHWLREHGLLEQSA